MHRDLLRLQVEAGDGVAVIRCEGELDLSVRDAFRQAIETSNSPDLTTIRIDATGLTFMDSSGLSCLIEAAQRCREHGTRLEVIPSEPVARLFELAGCSPMLAGGGAGSS